MLDLIKRKNTVDDLIRYIKEYYAGSDEKSIGVFIYFLHNLLVGLILIWVSVGDFGWIFNLSVFVILWVIGLHFYFNGCICIRLERHFLDDDKWYGLWTPLFDFMKYLGIELSSSNRSKVFVIVGGIFLIRVLYRLMKK